jgi:hypothetical protein
VVLGQVDIGLALPGLPGDDAVPDTDRTGHDQSQRAQPLRVPAGVPGEVFEGQHDEPVAGQQRQFLAILGEQPVHRRLAAARVGVVEHRHVVVHQRCAMQQFQRRRRRISNLRRVVPAGGGDGKHEPRARPRARRHDGVAHRAAEPGRAILGDAEFQGRFKGLLDALQHVHVDLQAGE